MSTNIHLFGSKLQLQCDQLPHMCCHAVPTMVDYSLKP